MNENIVIDGLEYPVSKEKFRWIQNGESSRYAYINNNPENFFDKNNIRVYNPNTKQHYFLERVIPKVGDSNLLLIDFSYGNQEFTDAVEYAIVRSWSQSKKDCGGDFVRLKIVYIDKDNYCRVYDDYNKNLSGSYAIDSFYKINKIL